MSEKELGQVLKELITEGRDDPTKKDSSNETALELALRRNRPELVFAFAQSTKVLLMLAKDLNLFRRTIFYLFDHAKDETSEYHHEALELFKSANKMSGNHRTRRIFSEMRAETLDEELVTKMKGIGSQELLKEIADGKIPYYDGFGNDFLSYLVQAKRVDLAMVVQEKYYLSNPRGGFIPHDPIRTALLENNPKFFHGKTFDPTQKMEISFFHDSLIESIALKTNNKINGQEWFGVFKQLIAGRAAEESFSDSLKLLPEPFRQEIESNFKEHHRSDSPSLMIGGGVAAHQLSRDLSVAPRGERK